MEQCRFLVRGRRHRPVERGSRGQVCPEGTTTNSLFGREVVYSLESVGIHASFAGPAMCLLTRDVSLQVRRYYCW